MSENRSRLLESAPPPRPADHALDRGTAAAASLTFVLRRPSPAPIMELRAQAPKARRSHEDADARGRASHRPWERSHQNRIEGAVLSCGLS